MEDNELTRLFEGIRQGLVEIRQDNDGIRQDNVEAHVETRRHFEVAIESATHELRLVAEGVSATREELARTAVDFSERIERVAAETQSMIRFSYADLERRMRTMEETQRTLEDSLSGLQSRVERLESSTH